MPKKGYKQTTEHKRRIGLASKGNKSNLGRKLSEKHKKNISLGGKGQKRSKETKRNISLALTGRKCSEETKRNISLAVKKVMKNPIARKKISEALKGIKLSEERRRNISMATKKILSNPIIRKKMSKSHLGKKHSEETKKKMRLTRVKQILPVKDTSIEVKVQMFLKELGYEYFTHQYMKIRHSYRCDILIPLMNLVIECDGDYWHKYPIGKEVDHIRTKELIEKGFKVLRLWGNEIKVMNINNFKNKLKEVFE